MNPDLTCLLGIAGIAVCFWLSPAVAVGAAGAALIAVGVHQKRKERKA